MTAIDLAGPPEEGRRLWEWTEVVPTGPSAAGDEARTEAVMHLIGRGMEVGAWRSTRSDAPTPATTWDR